ncbi:hypothetical protein CFP56_039347 [Quercus suber]|uniref:Uncharacterized protein n=1 Tax=Quercus suber TaxID=58331 RepID=A0AAW0LL10_QUESU
MGKLVELNAQTSGVPRTCPLTQGSSCHAWKPVKKRFQFEAMWVREDGCKDVVEEAWDPYCGVSGYSIMERLKRCQSAFSSLTSCDDDISGLAPIFYLLVKE